MQQWHNKQIISLTECNSDTTNKFCRSLNVTVAQETNYIALPMQQWHSKHLISLTECNSGTTNNLYLSPNATVAQQTNYIVH
jgi:hypothetical protein